MLEVEDENVCVRHITLSLPPIDSNENEYMHFQFRETVYGRVNKLSNWVDQLKAKYVRNESPLYLSVPYQACWTLDTDWILDPKPENR